MSLLVAVLTLLLLAVVIAMISAPLRAARREREPRSEPVRRELLTAREAKYREIRDAELDYRTGKLSREDFEAVDGALRVEAVEILKRLDSLDEASVLDDTSTVDDASFVDEASALDEVDEGDGEAKPRAS